MKGALFFGRFFRQELARFRRIAHTCLPTALRGAGSRPPRGLKAELALRAHVDVRRAVHGHLGICGHRERANFKLSTKSTQHTPAYSDNFANKCAKCANNLLKCANNFERVSLRPLSVTSGQVLAKSAKALAAASAGRRNSTMTV